MRPFAILLLASAATAAAPDWNRVDRDALDLLRKYIRMDADYEVFYPVLPNAAVINDHHCHKLLQLDCD